MNIITLDFETYYSREFSLTKLTTEEYVRSDLFQTIGVSVKENDLQTKLKLNQHRPESHAAMKSIYAAAGKDNERALALWMDRLNMGDAP